MISAANQPKLGSRVQHEFRTSDDPVLSLPQNGRAADTAAATGAPHRYRRGGSGAARAELLGLLPPGVRMPSTGGWAISADLLLHLVHLIRAGRYAHIVELGSGTSTCWLAWALAAFDIPGQVTSLEHHSWFRRRTRDCLREWGVHDRADVRLAMLREVRIEGVPYRWYDPACWADLRECDLLLVDGPPGRTGPMARFPAVPLLGPLMRPGAAVVLDDYKRADEREIVSRWRRLYPDWTLQALPHTKGTALLTVAGSAR